MEWWKLFSGTFVLIFLAELGDKTQLAAMAKTADSPGNSTAKWVVFLGASLALVLSTFIAVFLGQALKSLVPDERYIKIAAGTLFLIFGGMILYETYQSYRTPAPAEQPAPQATSQSGRAAPGLVGGLALKAAMDFETYAGARYRALAANASDSLAALLLELACEEDNHLAHLRNMPDGADGLACPLPSPAGQRIARDASPADPAILAELIRHEQATADFYQAMAERTVIPSVRAVFAQLAREEQSHAARLSAMGTAS